MMYANTMMVDGIEHIVTVLPLDMVPFFDPENPPQANTYCVGNDVQVGWVKNEAGEFVPPAV